MLFAPPPYRQEACLGEFSVAFSLFTLPRCFQPANFGGIAFYFNDDVCVRSPKHFVIRFAAIKQAQCSPAIPASIQCSRNGCRFYALLLSASNANASLLLTRANNAQTVMTFNSKLAQVLTNFLIAFCAQPATKLPLCVLVTFGVFA